MKDIKTFDEHLDEQYGEIGTEKRTNFEIKAKVSGKRSTSQLVNKLFFQIRSFAWGIEQITKKSLKLTANAWHVPCKPPAKNTWLNSNAKCAPRYGGIVPPLYSD